MIPLLPAAARAVIDLGPGWRHHQGDPAEAQSPSFPDADWASVDLPHSTTFTTPDDIAEYLGVTWYRTRLQIDPAWLGQRVTLTFGAVMQRADVWVDGVHAAHHVGGYTPFTVDLTHLLPGSGTAVIAVRADSRPDPGWPPGRTGVDFRYFGGIYRDATLTVTGPVHLTDPVAAAEVAGGGVFLTTPEVRADAAVVRVRSQVANDQPGARDVAVRVELVDPDGRVVASGERGTRIPAHGRATLQHDLAVADPLLWHPHHPWLYTARVRVTADGAEVDAVAERFGIRRIDWRRDGLFLNGERFRAIGVNRHQEVYGLGNAVPAAEIRRDVLRVKEGGFDFIRTAHYPNHPAFYDACDEFGVLVLNCVTGWQAFHDTEEFRENSYRELRDMIRRDRNHPSIVAWETSLNETEYPADWAETAHAIAHEEFPGDQLFTAGWKDHFDLFVGASQHGVRETAIAKPIIISEWGDWDHGGNASTSRVARESYDLGGGSGDTLQQTANHREGLNANLALPWFTADGLWAFADMSGYNATATLVGVVDSFRIPKSGYWFFRSQRDPAVRIPGVSTGPMVFIANTWSPGSPTRVTVYSNAERVRLHRDGRLVGTRSPDTGPGTESLPHPPFTFDAGPFAPGTLRAEALIGDRVVATASRTTAGAPARVELRPDTAEPLSADRRDVRLVFIDVVDANGTVVYTDTSDVHLAVEGAGVLLGPSTVRMRGGSLAAWVRATGAAGPITLSARADGLAPATATLEATSPRIPAAVPPR